MKTRGTLLAVFALLAACEPKMPPDSAASLATHPERLRAITQACREHRADMDAETCALAADAERRRFMGQDSAHYTPQADQAAPADQSRK